MKVEKIRVEEGVEVKSEGKYIYKKKVMQKIMEGKEQ